MVYSIHQLYRNHVLLLSAVLAFLLTASLTFASMYGSNTNAARELETQARMLSESLLAIPDADTSELSRMLAHASVNPSLALACLLTPEGDARAVVHGPAYEEIAPTPNCTMNMLQLNEHYLFVRSELVSDKLPQSMGEILLIGTLPSVKENLLRWAFMALALSLFFGMLCWFMGMRFEKALLIPLRQIASTSQRVTLYKDYSLRVVAGALNVPPREVQSLTDSFNAMLHEIEDRDTRLTRKSEELEKSRVAAVAASQAKSQFLANVSHELRTPLNAILGFSTMLSTEQFGPIGHEKYKEYARDIHDSGKHLLDVINDILDITKAESGSLRVHIEPLQLPKIIDKALHIIAGHAHARKIDIYTDLPEKMPKIYGDRVRLIQILLNLLSNAIKFSHEGGKVIVRARTEQGKNSVNYFTLDIVDEGIGMSPAELTSVFSAFNQSDMGLNRKYEGAGLGLPLTKKLVELHHGKIKIESVEGVGTTVTVRLTSDPALIV